MATTYSVKVMNDYKGYFESVVRGAIERKLKQGQTLVHQKFTVDSGPWRSYDCNWSESTDAEGVATLDIDFYSVRRTRGVGIEDSDELFSHL